MPALSQAQCDRIKRAEVALRQAAVDWANASKLPPIDANDSAFKPFDLALKRAAIDYADEVG